MINKSILPLAACALVLSLASGCGGDTPPLASRYAGASATDPASVVDPSPYASSGQEELLTNGQFVDGLDHWDSRGATVVASPLRPPALSMALSGEATQRLPAGRVVTGRAYSLVVAASLEHAGAAAMAAMQFRRRGTQELIRSYPIHVTSPTAGTYRVDFTAPPFSEMAEVYLATFGTPMQIESVSLVPRPAIEQTQPIEASGDSHVPPGYLLAFNDEFRGDTLDRSKWFTRYIHAGGTLDRLNDEQQRYRDNANHSVAGGVLSLIARKAGGPGSAGIDYESGMIRSDWTALHGYFEARVKMPRGVGMWPAFWLLSDVTQDGELSWPPEIDIFEFVNNGVEDRAHMLHSGVIPQPGTRSAVTYADPNFNADWNFYSADFRFDEGWHTVGAEWTPTQVSMFVDGRRIYSRDYQWNFADGRPAGPAHILLNLAVGGAWAGRHGVDDSALPQSFQIDWVRAYRRSP